MKRHSKIVPFALAALGLLCGAAGAPRPVWAGQQQVLPPIVVVTKKPKVEKFKGEVLSANSLQIVVRSRENTAIVRTFSYTPAVRQQMQKVIDRGGYQYGDPVEIQHEAGKDVAVKIKGKPSKPL
jgi:hypothetical protein